VTNKQKAMDKIDLLLEDMILKNGTIVGETIIDATGTITRLKEIKSLIENEKGMEVTDNVLCGTEYPNSADCPNCNKYLDIGSINYCYECGQKLIWPE
jgi:hypothetical protein